MSGGPSPFCRSSAGQRAARNPYFRLRCLSSSWVCAFTTQYVVELAKQFDVSTDYLLGMEQTATISVKGLTQRQVALLLEMIDCLREAGGSQQS